MAHMILDQTIVALDFSSLEEVKKFLASLDAAKNKAKYMKVGMELFYAEGKEVIDVIKSHGYKVFLDLKVHDIPNTCYAAVKNIVGLGADIINVHASGGIEMMKAARRAVDESGVDIKLIAVTYLTSMDEKVLHDELAINKSLDEAILGLAKNTKEAGLDGVVCSPKEAAMIKKHIGADFLTVCPGVRLAGAASHDQKRVCTPEEAISNGADLIVMGRAITQASEPLAILDLLAN